jgi:O-antigen/teichoic acid export membrane protein
MTSAAEIERPAGDSFGPACPRPEPQPVSSGGREKLQVAINAGSSAGVQVIKAIVVFLVTPIIVHRLGDVRYGIWLFISSITLYLAVGDFGVKSAIIRFVARYDGFHDDEGINRVINTSFAILLCVAAALLAIALLGAWLWRLPSSIPADLAGEARWFFVLSGIQMAMLLPIGVPQAALAGLGRFPLRNAISIVSLLLRHAALVIAVFCGGGLVAVGAVLVANCALDYGMAQWALRRSFPAGTRSLRYIDREMLRTLCGYGAHVFAGDIAILVIAQSAPLIIGLCLVSTANNTYYGLGASLKDNALSVLGMVVLVLVPAVSKWQAVGDHGAIRGLLVHATRYALYFTLPIEFGLLVLGYPFLALWMGPRYADAGCKALYILTLPLALSAIGMVAARVMLGIGKVRPLAVITGIQAMLTVALSLALSQAYGIEGVAWGVSLAVLACAPATAFLLCGYVHVGPLAMLARASWGPLLAAAAAAAVWFAAIRWLPNAWQPKYSWAAFAAVGLLGAAPYAAVALWLERDFRHAAGAMTRSLAAAFNSVLQSRTSWRGAGKIER